MNLGTVLLGALLVVLFARALFWLFVQDSAAFWYKQRDAGLIGPKKPWYVHRFDRQQAMRPRKFS